MTTEHSFNIISCSGDFDLDDFFLLFWGTGGSSDVGSSAEMPEWEGVFFATEPKKWASVAAQLSTFIA